MVGNEKIPLEPFDKISKEVREENGEAEQKLSHKCNWEHMTRTAVIMQYGDPRNW